MQNIPSLKIQYAKRIINGENLILEYAEKIESKARKEFAERLKEIASEIIIGGKYKYRVVTIESIYNTLAELSNQTEKGGAE